MVGLAARHRDSSTVSEPCMQTGAGRVHTPRLPTVPLLQGEEQGPQSDEVRQYGAEHAIVLHA